MEERGLPPPVLQAPGSLDCGLCAVKYILNRHGLDADLEGLRARTRWGQDGRRGNWPTDLIVTLMEDYGFDRLNPPMIRQQIGRVGVDTLSALRAWLDRGWIGLLNYHYVASIGHYLVVDAIDEQNRLLITCSLNGRRWWTAEEFFAGYDGKGDGHMWWLVRGPEPCFESNTL